MGHVKNIEKTAVVSFEKVGFKTPVKVAAEMRRDVLAFFKKNPRGKIEFHFGGYARLSAKFAKELLKNDADGTLAKYLNQIVVRKMHIFDQQLVQEAL